MSADHDCLRPVDPGIVGVRPCPRCQQRTVKLPGRYEPLCLDCFAEERTAYERMLIANGRPVAGQIAGPECLGCGGTDVDADGRTWWCLGCGIVSGVACGCAAGTRP
ncbi:hypothetical protein [Streptomyces sp. YIM 98790]|uniref:hypothetical protein n=1 Tax=Streptomyces sp. YIM 98790 TaxID=2689077 RepID=UPI00140B5FAA|nr:hypothetical protein [Streptomyces sp. YIM 98790]